MKKKQTKKYLKQIWQIVWGGFYVSILILNFFLQDTWPVKAIMCLGIAMNILYAYCNSPKDHLLQIALALTFFADIILALNNTSFLGVFVFTFAQFVHLVRMTNLNSQHLLAFLVILTILFFLSSLLRLEPMFVIGTTYAMLLCANFYVSYSWNKATHSTSARHAVIGFSLFVLCDICVATSYFTRIGTIPISIHPYADYLAWIFYYPSQILLANSSKIQKTMIQ